MSNDPSNPPSGPSIIRRHPTGPIPSGDDTRTGIIRRTPTGSIPAAETSTGYIARPPADQAATGFIRPSGGEAPTGLIRSSAAIQAEPTKPSSRTAVATAAVSIISGWATGVIATNLIVGWWQTDTLFCAAVAFVTIVLAAAIIAGVILLLFRHRIGSLLIIAGAVLTLLIYTGLFLAGARIPLVVHALPVLPLASAALAVLPGTRSWWFPRG